MFDIGSTWVYFGSRSIYFPDCWVCSVFFGSSLGCLLPDWAQSGMIWVWVGLGLYLMMVGSDPVWVHFDQFCSVLGLVWVFPGLVRVCFEPDPGLVRVASYFLDIFLFVFFRKPLERNDKLSVLNGRLQ